jgi:hypothetical protein
MNMADATEKRRIAIVSACMTSNGLPAFALNEVEVTKEEAENGLQYCLAEAELLSAGYEEPFVHFAEGEGPAFLHPAVRQYLDESACVPDPITHIALLEEP